MKWHRVGVALGRLRESTYKPTWKSDLQPCMRRDEYEILIDPAFPETKRVRYIGHREYRKVEVEDSGEATEEVQVGLPFAGPGAVWAHPVVDFDPDRYDIIKWLKEPVPVDW